MSLQAQGLRNKARKAVQGKRRKPRKPAQVIARNLASDVWHIVTHDGLFKCTGKVPTNVGSAVAMPWDKATCKNCKRKGK